MERGGWLTQIGVFISIKCMFARSFPRRGRYFQSNLNGKEKQQEVVSTLALINFKRTFFLYINNYLSIINNFLIIFLYHI